MSIVFSPEMLRAFVQMQADISDLQHAVAELKAELDKPQANETTTEKNA